MGMRNNPDRADSEGDINNTPLCGRCYDHAELFPANCQERPELLVSQPLGMYHCPDCGAMILAGVKHPDLCQRCLDRRHPAFDQCQSEAER